jgi:hypothetical protein
MPQCDHCSKDAVQNYQRIWHAFSVTRSGDYADERVDYDLEEPANADNLHLCAHHEALFLARAL